MSIPTLPSVGAYIERSYDDYGSYVGTKNIICSLCAKRMEGKWPLEDCLVFERVPPPDMYEDWVRGTDLWICCCQECEELVDNVIEGIFSNYPGVENFPPSFIKNIFPKQITLIKRHLYTHDCDTGDMVSLDDSKNKVMFAYNVLRSEEYRQLVDTLDSMCVWNTPDIKL